MATLLWIAIPILAILIQGLSVADAIVNSLVAVTVCSMAALMLSLFFSQTVTTETPVSEYTCVETNEGLVVEFDGELYEEPLFGTENRLVHQAQKPDAWLPGWTEYGLVKTESIYIQSCQDSL